MFDISENKHKAKIYKRIIGRFVLIKAKKGAKMAKRRKKVKKKKKGKKKRRRRR